MSEQMIPLAEVAELIVSIVHGTAKQAEILAAEDKPSVPVKISAEEDEDVKLNDTKSEDAVKTMAKAVGNTTDAYTGKGSQTEAVDESSAVETERGSVVASDEKTAAIQSKILEKVAAAILAGDIDKAELWLDVLEGAWQ